MYDRLKELLDPYDKCQVECDGFVRIASYVLNENNIPHKVYFGCAFVRNVTDTDHDAVVPHFWIGVDDEDGLEITVDYRLRMWTGDHAPHGIFYNEDCGVDYEVSTELQLDVTSAIFAILAK